jgi:8-oxo-dGTP pyrophosphatase MutT (NUDIX family)
MTVSPGPADERVAALRRTLRAHRPADDAEAAALGRFLAELARLPRPLDEAADPVHVTASAVVVGRRGTLLHRHKRLGLWLQPGGHLDPRESPADAARRETAEETGLRVTAPAGAPTLIHVDVHQAARGHTHLDLRYLFTGPDAPPVPPAGESPEVRWFSWAEALTVADASLAGALRAARRHLPAPVEG